ncbi:hypothetical protein GBA52_025118 [Prunus armeniaca]|nr:hypothetical protein GBA52_025118 [Prunus armeniaca]
MDASMDPMSLPLDTQSYLVKVRRIPLLFLMPVTGKKIGNYLGTFFMVDRGLNGDCLGSFLRIRVGLNVLETLKRCVMLRLVVKEPTKQYEIEYERIPIFSLFCGKLDHVGSHYKLAEAFDGQGGQKDDMEVKVERGAESPLVSLFKRKRVDYSCAPGLDNPSSLDIGLEKSGEVQGNDSLVEAEVTHISDGIGEFNKGKHIALEEVPILYGNVSPGAKAKGIGRGFRVGRARPRSSPKKEKDPRKGVLSNKGIGWSLVHSVSKVGQSVMGLGNWAHHEK